jgi:WD40 repeat protein
MTGEPSHDKNPFPGLRPFEDDEAYLFFGRETQVDELLRRLRSQRFIAVVGTSGSGKSSLIRAGLYPALRVGAMSGAGSHWRIATMRPGNDPIGELARALESAGLLGEDADAELRTDLAYAVLERGALGLVEVVRQMPVRSNDNVLIVVDQFEELFRYAQTAVDAATAFVNLLLAASAQPGLRLYVVLTMRSDFLGDCAAFAELPERINRGLYLVPRMTREQLEAAIVGPVKVASAAITPRLVNRLLNDVGDDPDQLPVLAHALMVTYDLWTADHAPGEPIDERHYRATGGLSKAIDVHAERVFSTLTPSQQEVAEKMFAAITELGSDNRGIRRPLALAGIAAVSDADPVDLRAVVDAYRARTCSFLRPPPEVVLADRTIVDIAHEALMRGWSRLRRLLDEEVDSARTYRRLSDAAEQHSAGKSALLIDPALGLDLAWRDRRKPTAAWAERYGGSFANAMTFLEQSDRERTRKRDAERSARRRRWTLALGVITVLALLTFVSVASVLGSRRAQTQSLVAQSGFLARDANATIERSDAVSGMLFALEALPQRLDRPDRPYTRAAELALENGLNNQDELRDLTMDSSSPSLFGISPDGEHFAVGLLDFSVHIYDGKDRLVRVLRGHKNYLDSLAYSPDGKKIVTGSADSTVRVWNSQTGRLLKIVRETTDCTSVWFSPDESSLMIATIDGRVQILSPRTYEVIHAWRVGARTYDAEYSPDGHRIITGGPDGIGRLWDAKSGRLLRTLRFHTKAINQNVFSPDGTHIATASFDGTAIIWNARTGAVEEILHHEAEVEGVAFAPDSRTIVTSSLDRTARIWDVASGTLLATLAGHSGGVNQAIFSRDGARVLTAGSDGTVRTWRNPVSSVVVLRGHRARVEGVAFSHDGRFLVTGSDDRTARIWDVRTGKMLHILRGRTIPDSVPPRGRGFGIPTFSPDDHTVVVPSFFDGELRLFDTDDWRERREISCAAPLCWYAVYSPDGDLIAASVNKDARIYNAQSGKLLAVLRGHKKNVEGIAFSPNGRFLATASYDTTARIWDVASARTVHVLRGHHDAIIGIAYSPDGTRIATGSTDGTAKVWDADSGKIIRTIDPQHGQIVGVDFSPDGTELSIAMALEQTVRLFDLETGAPIDVLRGAPGQSDWGVFSPDGRRIAKSSESGEVAQIFSVPPRLHCQALIDAANAAVPRQLSDAQRADEFLGPRSSPPLLGFDGNTTCH